MARALSALTLLMAGILPAGLAWAPSAAAHAIVVSSAPKVNESLPKASSGPLTVWVRFNSRLDKERSRLALVAPDGSESELAATMEGPPELLQAQARIVQPGSYRLRWRVLAADGHITRGDIPFTVTED